MKSNIKKDYVLKYLQNKFNDTTQDVGFMFGIDGMPLYTPVTKDSSKGEATEEYEFDADTYEKSITNYVPVSFPVIQGDYANVATIEQDKRITSSSWSIVVSFLVYVNSYVHNKMLFTIEEFRDNFIGKIDFLEGREYDFNQTGVRPITKWYKVVTSAQDVVPNGLITINGNKYLEYTLQIDLDVIDDLSFGNQFEFYVQTDYIHEYQLTTGTTYDLAVNQTGLTEPNLSLLANPQTLEIGYIVRIETYDGGSVFTYYRVGYATNSGFYRVLPIQVSWGASNGLEGKQLIKNKYLTTEEQEKAKMIHNLVASRGFAINMTFMFEPNHVIKELFKETYRKNTVMNKPYRIKMMFKDVVINDNVPSFEYDNDIGFEYDVVISENATEVIYGEKVLFTVGFTPSWNKGD